MRKNALIITIGLTILSIIFSLWNYFLELFGIGKSLFSPELSILTITLISVIWYTYFTYNTLLFYKDSDLNKLEESTNLYCNLLQSIFIETSYIHAGLRINLIAYPKLNEAQRSEILAGNLYFNLHKPNILTISLFREKLLLHPKTPPKIILYLSLFINELVFYIESNDPELLLRNLASCSIGNENKHFQNVNDEMIFSSKNLQEFSYNLRMHIKAEMDNHNSTLHNESFNFEPKYETPII